jgi:hypothetical protein
MKQEMHKTYKTKFGIFIVTKDHWLLRADSIALIGGPELKIIGHLYNYNCVKVDKSESKLVFFGSGFYSETRGFYYCSGTKEDNFRIRHMEELEPYVKSLEIHSHPPSNIEFISEKGLLVKIDIKVEPDEYPTPPLQSDFYIFSYL